MSFKLCTILMAVAVVAATPTGSFWKGTFVDASLEEARELCDRDDALACIKYKAMAFIDDLLDRGVYQLGEDVQVTKTGSFSSDSTARADATWADKLASYIKAHEVTFNLPMADSRVTLDARNLDQDELAVRLQFSGVEEARRSKLRKILVPILVFVLLKAITLIPLALGVLGLKAWNALQLSFFSFVVSVSLAVFQLCKKIAADSAPPQIAHSPWETLGHYAARSLGDDEDAQQLAYSAHSP